GNDCPADINGDNCAGPVGHEGNYVAHANEINHLAGNNVRFGKLCRWNVDVAPEKRAKEDQHGRAGVETDPHIGITQEPKLDENEQSKKDNCEDRIEAYGNGEIMKMARMHWSFVLRFPVRQT